MGTGAAPLSRTRPAPQPRDPPGIGSPRPPGARKGSTVGRRDWRAGKGWGWGGGALSVGGRCRGEAGPQEHCPAPCWAVTRKPGRTRSGGRRPTRRPFAPVRPVVTTADAPRVWLPAGSFSEAAFPRTRLSTQSGPPPPHCWDPWLEIWSDGSRGAGAADPLHRHPCSPFPTARPPSGRGTRGLGGGGSAELGFCAPGAETERKPPAFTCRSAPGAASLAFSPG